MDRYVIHVSGDIEIPKTPGVGGEALVRELCQLLDRTLVGYSAELRLSATLPCTLQNEDRQFLVLAGDKDTAENRELAERTHWYHLTLFASKWALWPIERRNFLAASDDTANQMAATLAGTLSWELHRGTKRVGRNK